MKIAKENHEFSPKPDYGTQGPERKFWRSGAGPGYT
jgi:hypothetical protein